MGAITVSPEDVLSSSPAIERYAKPEAALPPGADHDRPWNCLIEPELDVGVG